MGLARDSPCFLPSDFGPIEWDIEDDPQVSGDSGDPLDPQTGTSVTLTVTAPAADTGRAFKLNYRIRAKVTIEGATHYGDWEPIIQDDKDQLRQIYIDTGYSPVPSRSSAALVTAGTYQNPGNLSFEELSCNAGSYCGGHAYQLNNTVATVFQSVRNQHGGPIIVNSAYRCPRWNIHEGGETNSKHTQGNAFDFDNGEAPQNWAVAQSAMNAEVSTSKILLYPQSGSYHDLQWFIDNGYNGTNLPPGWTTYRFGHVTTSTD